MQDASPQDIAFFQASLDSPKDILVFSIDRDYSYRAFNKAFSSATSFAYGTIVRYGMTLFDTITADADRTKAKANCDRALSGESLHTVEEYGTVHPAVYETHYSPIHNTGGDVIGVTVCASNITARFLAEQQVRALNRELESFTYTAAHDLRVPLRVINGYSKILSEDYKNALDEEGQRLISIISTQATHMGRLIDDLLTYAQLGRQTLSLRMTSLKDIAQQVIDEHVLLSPETRAKFTLTDLPPANCDPSLIRIVFANLVSNAVKFSSKNELSVVDIGYIMQGSNVIYYVRDNGVGFNMEYSGKLFGLFQRLHKPAEFQGTGVGLAVIHRIIEKHGGKVWFESEPNKGATFYFNL